jgi:hypothetical protein
MAGQLVLNGQQTGVGSGSPWIGPFTLTLSNVEVRTIQLVSVGNQQIFIPSPSPNFVILIPPATLAVTVTLKGASGDVGIPIFSATQLQPFILPVSIASAFFLNFSGTQAATYIELVYC